MTGEYILFTRKKTVAKKAATIKRFEYHLSNELKKQTNRSISLIINLALQKINIRFVNLIKTIMLKQKISISADLLDL